MGSQNCISYWYPKLLQANVPTPETWLLPCPLDLMQLLDGADVDGFESWVETLARLGDLVDWPCFLRTGHTSGKHAWWQTCHVHARDQLSEHVVALVEWSTCSSLIGLPTDMWAVRKLLPVTPAFSAFGGTPICCEQRFFIDRGEVIYNLPYWPKDAIRQPSSVDWKMKLASLNILSFQEICQVHDYTEQVAEQFDGAWSVDWMLTDDGWYCIDMARAEVSWGYDASKFMISHGSDV